jgi:diguanylate cyclase (GGDEF)-like protein
LTGESTDPLRRASSPHFDAPAVAIPIRTRGGWIFATAVFAVAILCALLLGNAPALWPTPSPLSSAIVLAALLAAANLFGTFQTFGGLSEFASLAMPIAFAMLLLLDWHLFVLAVALGEALTFVSEFVRRVNPTMWYIRIFNACELTVAGAASVALLHALGPIAAQSSDTARTGWLSPGLAVALLLAAVVYKIADSVLSATLIALAANQSVASIRIPIRTVLSQFVLFLIGIPFAKLWQENVWVAIFAIAPLGVAYRLLGLPELEHRARFDARTGLANAGSFDTLLQRAVEEVENGGRTVALLAIDIDHFKTINDTFGHLVGDAVIARFAALLEELARSGDVAARLGGEEFAIVMRDASRTGALALAERIRQRVETERFDVDVAFGVPIRVTASIGVALSPDDGRSPQALHGAADAALYRAKQAGRNAVREARLADSA